MNLVSVVKANQTNIVKALIWFVFQVNGHLMLDAKIEIWYKVNLFVCAKML